MTGSRKFLLLHLDKVLCGVVGALTLVVIFSSIYDLSATPDAVVKADQASERAEKHIEPPPPFPPFDLLPRFKETRAWNIKAPGAGRNLSYMQETQPIEEPKKKYEEALKAHEHIYFTVAGGAEGAKRVCAFPGCPNEEPVEKDHIGVCSGFKSSEQTVTTLALEWDDPADLSQNVAIQYCMLERRKFKEDQKPEDGWVDVADRQGNPIRVRGGTAVQDAEGGLDHAATPKPEGGFQMPQAPAGGGFQMPMPGGMPGMPPEFGMPPPGLKPPKPFQPPKALPKPLAPGEKKDPDVEKIHPELSRLSLSAHQAIELLQSKEESEGKRELKKRLRSIELSEDKALAALEKLKKEDEGAAPIQQNHYKVVDFNLDANTEYDYRVRAVGTGSQSEIKGAWTPALKIKTKEDKGLRFTSYAAAIHTGDKVVSPERVTLVISKLFDPHWPPFMKYFIQFEHPSIVPGDKDQGRVGRQAVKHRIKDKDGDNVLWDSLNKEFITKETPGYSSPVKPPPNKKNIDYYREDVDFTTKWLADHIEERTAEEKVVVKRINEKTGQYEEVPETKIQYRYFLILKDKENPKTQMEVELERRNKNDYYTPIRKTQSQGPGAGAGNGVVPAEAPAAVEKPAAAPSAVTEGAKP